MSGEVVDVLQSLIRNRCVNDGSQGSGQEWKNANFLKDYLKVSDIVFETYEPVDGRVSFSARLPGFDPTAPSLCLLSHLDVVPASTEGWRYDPFEAELVAGEVWGRGAVDMFNLTSTMAYVFKEFLQSDKQLKGDLVFVATADEEAGGALGAKYVTENYWDKVGADFVLTEYGGVQSVNSGVINIFVAAAEKGPDWRRIVVHGTPGHGSMPYKADNAVIKAAEVIRRISNYKSGASINEFWKNTVQSIDIDPDTKSRLMDEKYLDDSLAEFPIELARNFHACTHTTFSPNMVTAGSKTNTIADKAIIDVDIRVLPGETSQSVDDHLRAALGDLYAQIEVESIFKYESDKPLGSVSVDSGRLWSSLALAAKNYSKDAVIRAGMVSGATDARFYRDKRSLVYGVGLLDSSITSADFLSRFHGRNERIDLNSLELTISLLRDTIKVFWDDYES